MKELCKGPCVRWAMYGGMCPHLSAALTLTLLPPPPPPPRNVWIYECCVCARVPGLVGHRMFTCTAQRATERTARPPPLSAL